MKQMIDIPKEVKAVIDRNGTDEHVTETLWQAVKNGTPLEKIQNPCIECSQNCCVCELNGEKCECQRVYVVKENKK